MRVNISRTFMEASASVTAPSGRVPFTGAETSGMRFSREAAAGFDKSRCEMENAFDDVQRDRIAGARFADAGREHEAKNAAARFLVGAHDVEQSSGGDVRPGRQWPETADERDNTRNIAGAHQSKFMAEERRGDHPPGNGFAVLVAAVVGDAFERVREGVTEIQDFAEAGLAFIAADDTRFDPDVARDELAECRTIATQDVFQVLLEHREHGCVGNDSVLHDFGEAAAKFAVRERAE